MTDELLFDPFTSEIHGETTPESAIYGDYLLVSLDKFWFKFKRRAGNDEDEGGLTISKPYGHETKLALPLCDNPVTDLPENCITLEQMKVAFNATINTMKKLKEN